ncbi:dual specificity protein phosphatase CDC14C-like [Diabrotica virgifera virgifera]|uniref:protein-tyrosine-phosphatase n=1 Tax=Diabrotica virgifera virgifera TaxID=50390 RepID=A0ABM5K1B2_DIAVI|nr:dual specificity protein phosphatase CDC14C-like [Diabrotica virgifera virgifera]
MDKQISTPREVANYVEVVHKQLYFAVLSGKEIIKLKYSNNNNNKVLFFCIDDEFYYENYYNDFGPFNISCLYKYCLKIRKYIDCAKGVKCVVHYTSEYPEKKANAACLMGLFCIMYLNFQPKDIWNILLKLGPYKLFWDASLQSCGFHLRIIDCLYSIQRAVTYNFVNFDDFDVSEYDTCDKLQYGHMNWLLPRKFLAFIGPADNRTAHSPHFYIKYFLNNDVKTIIRLNVPSYNAAAFTKVGIEHFDLIFPDGSTPSKDVVIKFLAIAEAAPAAIAVHCKAGLGRTGSLIGAYLMKHYQMSAREAIAWMRMCRPGSVIGQQQLWLEKVESWLWKTGIEYRLRLFGAMDAIPKHAYGIYSKQWLRDREKIITETRRKLRPTLARTKISKGSEKNISLSVESFAKMSRIQKHNRRKMTEDNIQGHPFKNFTKLLGDVRLQNKRPSTLGNNLNRKTTVCNSPKHSFIPSFAKSSFTSRNERGRNEQLFTPIPDKRKAQKITQGDRLNQIKASWNSNKPFEYRPYTENITQRKFLSNLS